MGAQAATGLRVVVADDSFLLREGLSLMLGDAGHEVVAAVEDGPSFVRAMAEHRPDLGITDVRMPPSHTDEGMRAAVEQVAAGGTSLDPEVVSQLFGRRRAAADPVQTLTPREQDVLALMAQGLSNAGIARELVVTAGAVEKHSQRIFAKLGLAETEDHRRVQAVLAWLRREG